MNWEEKYNAIAELVDGYRHERNEALERVRLLEAEVERVNAREDATRRELYATCIDMRDMERERDEARAEVAVAEQRFVDEYDARKAAEREIAELLRVNKGAAQHGIITEYVRELIELLGIQRQNPTANETVDAAATEIETLRTTVDELKARITTLEAMKP